MKIETPGYPDFYQDEPITITCSATEYSSIGEVRLLSDSGSTFCYLSVSQRWDGGGDLDTLLGLSDPTSSHCTAAAQSPPFDMVVTGTVSEKMKGASLYCEAYVSSSNYDQTDPLVVVDEIKGNILVGICLYIITS